MRYAVQRGRVVEKEFGKYETREEAEKQMVKNQKANRARRERESVLRSCGLVKVRGAAGGTYWE